MAVVLASYQYLDDIIGLRGNLSQGAKKFSTLLFIYGIDRINDDGKRVLLR